MKTTEAARGKWREVLKRLGLDDSYLRNIHGPCPMCGGQDRYRFDDKDGAGTYYCNSCGAGDGMKLALLWSGREFRELAREIDEMIGNIQPEIQQKPTQDPMIRIAKIWSESVRIFGSDPVSRYLAFRGVSKSYALRYHPELPYYEEGKLIGKFPSMIAPVLSPSGDLITLHVTYLNHEGKKASVKCPKKMLPPAGDTSGACVQLTKVYEHIGIAEGIETACAAMKLFQMPVWAACNAGMLEKFVPPAGIKKITVYSDNDASYRGQAAAFRLANRLVERAGLDVEVKVPEIVGDFADLV